jgi:hypothetical protein
MSYGGLVTVLPHAAFEQAVKDWPTSISPCARELCSCVSIPNDRAHDALERLATADEFKPKASFEGI